MTPKRNRKQATSHHTLLEDRVSYLENVANPVVSFTNKADAKQFIAKIRDTKGVRYDLQSRKIGKRTEYRALLRYVDAQAVRRSSEYHSIIRDLKSGGKGARSRKAKALENVGRRENFWTWAVGETNE